MLASRMQKHDCSCGLFVSMLVEDPRNRLEGLELSIVVVIRGIHVGHKASKDPE